MPKGTLPEPKAEPEGKFKSGDHPGPDIYKLPGLHLGSPGPGNPLNFDISKAESLLLSQSTPADQYQSALNMALDLFKIKEEKGPTSSLGSPLPTPFSKLEQELTTEKKEELLDLLLKHLDRLGTEAKKSPDEIAQDKKKIYSAAFEYYRNQAVEHARTGPPDDNTLESYIKEMDRFGSLAGKTKQEIVKESQAVYFEYFKLNSDKAMDLAKQGLNGDAFKDALAKTEWYAARAGLDQSQWETSRQLIFAELYKFKLEEVLKKDITNPDDEIKFRGGTLEVQGYDSSEIIFSGRLAGKSDKEIFEDINKLKQDIKDRNLKQVTRDLIQGINKVKNAPIRVAERIVDSIKETRQEVVQGYDQMTQGMARFIRGII